MVRIFIIYYKNVLVPASQIKYVSSLAFYDSKLNNTFGFRQYWWEFFSIFSDNANAFVKQSEALSIEKGQNVSM